MDGSRHAAPSRCEGLSSGWALPLKGAVREKGLFASQITVCRLRDEHTIKTVEAAFGLDPAN